MKNYKNHVSIALFVLFLTLLSGQCFARAQYLRVHNDIKKGYDIRVVQVEEFKRTLGEYNQGDREKFDFKELDRIKPKRGGEIYTSYWWLGMVPYGKNFDYHPHEATLKILKEGTDEVVGEKKFYLKPYSKPDTLSADGKIFTINVTAENETFWEEGKGTGIKYYDYKVNVGCNNCDEGSDAGTKK